MVMSKKEDKWALTEWKNEPKYTNTKVLVGNWFEERLVFPKGNTTNNSTNRIDFGIPNDDVTDRRTRRKLAHRNWEGVGENNLLSHHGKAYMSGAKESIYGNNYDHPSSRIPYPLRRWNSHTMSWVPERIEVTSRGKETQKITNDKADKVETANNPRDTLPPIHVPDTWDGRVVFKYRHRKTDIAPYFPVILRNCEKHSHVVNIQSCFK